MVLPSFCGTFCLVEGMFTMIYKGATLYPVSSQPIIADLRVENGKIKEIGVDLQGDDIYDVSNKIITPGFIDSHTHLGLYDEGTGWAGNDANETSGIITPHVRAIDGCDIYDVAFHEARQWGVTTVNIMPGSANVIGGTSSVIKTFGNRIEDMIIRECSGLKIALGENPKKRHSAGKGELTRMGIMGILREIFTNVKEQIERDEIIPFTSRSVEKALLREVPVRIHAHRRDDILSAIRFAEEFNLDLRIEHCTEGHLIADELERTPYPVSIGPTLTRRSKVELRNKSWKVYSELAKRNMPFSITTDHPYTPIQYLQLATSISIREGLTEEQALRAITLSPAENLGVENRVGSLDVGKDADFVIWDGNPFHFCSRVIETRINGKVVYKADNEED